jgi:peptide/nickel transport system permease protein
MQNIATPVGLKRPLSLPFPDLSGIGHLLGHRRSLIGLAIIAPFIFVAIAAPYLPLQDPLATDPTVSLHAPSAAHPLGTDKIGRDVLSRVAAGAKTSLFVGFAVATIAVSAGILVGTVTGFMGKFLDATVMSIVDIFLSFPGLLLAIAMVAVFGAGMWQVILAIAISDIPRAIRLQRSLVLGLKSRQYIDAARMAHAPTWWLLARHVVPNTVAPMLVVASIYAANAVLVEASLSFLGLGITPPEPSWGNIIREGQVYLERAWWVSTFPGVAILILSIGLHLVSDGVRETLDPSMRS